MTKKSGKKLIALSVVAVLLAALCLTLAACGEGEDETAVYDYLSFNYSESLQGLEVSLMPGSTVSGAISLPSQYYADSDTVRDPAKKTRVVAVADGAFKNYTRITSVALPDTVRSIGADAFYGNVKLTDINLDNVERIGEAAFKGCSELTGVTVNKLTQFSDSVFYECIKLKTISGEAKITKIGNFAFSRCVTLMSVGCDFSALTSIGDSAFFFTGCITYFKIPSPSICASVGSYAFRGWSEYQTVECTPGGGWSALWNADSNAKFAS